MEEQEEKERKKKEEEKADAVDDLGKSLGEVALVQSTGQVIIVFQQCHHLTMIEYQHHYEKISGCDA